MEETTLYAQAERIAQEVEPDSGTVEVGRIGIDDSVRLDYTEHVNCHRLSEGWTVTGVGDGWLTIEEDY